MIFGQWYPVRTQGLTVVAGVSRSEMVKDKHNSAPFVYSVFDDRLEPDSVFEASWNAFWHFANVMQFLPKFAGVTEQGVQAAVYGSLSALPPGEQRQLDLPSEPWQEVYDAIFDDLARVIATELERTGSPPPSCIGYELVDEKGRIIGQAEMAWESEKVVWLLPGQEDFREDFQAQGWKVYAGDEIPSIEVLKQEA